MLNTSFVGSDHQESVIYHSKLWEKILKIWIMDWIITDLF